MNEDIENFELKTDGNKDIYEVDDPTQIEIVNPDEIQFKEVPVNLRVYTKRKIDKLMNNKELCERYNIEKVNDIIELCLASFTDYIEDGYHQVVLNEISDNLTALQIKGLRELYNLDTYDDVVSNAINYLFKFRNP